MKKIIALISIFFFVNIMNSKFTFANQPASINESGNEITSSESTQKVRKWSFGVGLQWFASRSEKTYSAALKTAGLGGKKWVADGFLGKYKYLKNPQSEMVGYRYYYYVERMIKKPFFVGGLYTCFGSAKLQGWDPEAWISIDVSDKGKGYYIYALASSDRTKSFSLQAGLGVGATKIIYIATAYSELGTSDDKTIGPKLTKWSPGIYISVGADITIFGLFIIGSHIHYWYVPPLVVDPYIINYRGFRYEFPEQKINFGGFSIGITIGFRPF